MKIAAIFAVMLSLASGCGASKDKENKRLRAEIDKLKIEIESLKIPEEQKVKPEVNSNIPNQAFDPYDKSGGIGAYLHKDPFSGVVTILSTIQDLPCAKAGIISGDQILSIDGKETKGMSQAEVVAHLIGPIGKKVNLTIRELKIGQNREVEIVRAKIVPDPIDKLSIKGVSLEMELENATRLLNEASPTLKLVVKKNKKGDRNEVNNGGVWMTTDKDGKINKIDFSRSACDKLFSTDGYSHNKFMRQFSLSYKIPLISFNRKRDDLVGEIGQSSPRSNDLLPRIGFITKATESGWEYHNAAKGLKVSITYEQYIRINSGDTKEHVPSSYLVIQATEKPAFD